MAKGKSKGAAGKTTLEELYASISERKRPEDVADLILTLLKGQLSQAEQQILEKAALGSLKRQYYLYWSSLRDEFVKPVGMEKQVRKAEEFFTGITPLTDEQCSNPQLVEDFIGKCSKTLQREKRSGDFKTGRLNREERKKAALGEVSKRQYNKRFRLVTRMEERVLALAKEVKKYETTVIGKQGLGRELGWEEFRMNQDSAALVAYLTARKGLRSVFTNTRQVGAYDDIAEMLMERCRKSPSSNWWAIAHVNSSPEVLGNLSDEKKGELFARWFLLLQTTGKLLEEVFLNGDLDRSNMIVRSGQDSSTWNLAAQSWNTARASWIDCCFAMGMGSIVDGLCIGKVMRLMAADVASWHEYSGETEHPDTRVAARLPLPWEVLSGREKCTAQMVREACKEEGVDPEISGWVAPRPRNYIESFTATPELVHGINVGDPGLAEFLKKAGVFSGKNLRFPPGTSVVAGPGGRII